MEIIPVSLRQKQALLSQGNTIKNLKLKLQCQQISLQKGFDRLICLNEINIDPKPWQSEAALKTLRDMQGSAILADEVGLGKTIEAGLIIKELLVRGLIKSLLILVPAPLVEQWKTEMVEKFDITLVDLKESSWDKHCLLISSMPRVVRSESVKTKLRDKVFDLLVIDEAHSLKNHATATYKFVFGVKRKNTILMSATPIQNNMMELYNLVNILKPGYLTTRNNFRSEYMADRFTPKNIKKLRQLLTEVMIRNRRSNTLVELPRRLVNNIDIELTSQERQFHNGVVDFCKQVYSKYVNGVISLGTDKREVSILLLLLISLLKQNCSSPQSVVRTLKEKMLFKLQTSQEKGLCQQLISLGESIYLPSKANTLLSYLAKSRDQVIVYSEYIPTIELLKEQCTRAGISVIDYHGGLSLQRKVAAIQKFKEGAYQVFLSSESGGQGLNLQFCHRLINYDLPWNPMRIEQRIGRVHRFGQKQEVDIFTMATRGTIDEYLLFVLTSKVNLFELVIGELDTILSFMLNDTDHLDVRIGKIILGSKDSKEVEKKLREIGEEMLRAKEEMKSTTDRSIEVLDCIGVGV